jgi:hypothetical protein
MRVPGAIAASLFAILLGLKLVREDETLTVGSFTLPTLGLFWLAGGGIGLVVACRKHGFRWLLPERRPRILMCLAIAAALAVVVLAIIALTR